ncbi:MAG: UDP-glucose/GDP-mannose dehydrogenase family protein [Gemmatimonadetes bacterium]|nr:UDP-glucose/GDP-mannose dehydrogenase family protein [Gemmatimonadota bacterium]
MNVAVVGTGYVGLVAGACLAETGNRVTCVDIDERKVADLRRGEIPIYEPGLEEIVRRNVGAGRLVFTTKLEGAVRSARVVFIAVGTPPDEDGSADLQHVLAVAQGIGRAMVGETVVVTKSTVPVGTARRVREAIEAETDQPVHVCSNPEFLKEGDAVDDFMKPDRVVVGVDHPAAEAALRELYGPFLRTGNALMVMDIPSAEITKYAANAMLATRISFMNTIAQLCERTGANVDAVRRGVGSDARIGSAFLFPGVGYGGSCFPKDVKALIRTSRELGASASILEAVEQVNADQKRLLLERVVKRFGDDLAGHTFAVWGLAFKPNTDDMREAPSRVTIEGLLERGARIAAHDPEAGDEARRIFGDRIDIRDSNYDALDGASALLIHTEWLPYRRPDFDAMRERLAQPILFDGRNLYAPVEMARRGFEYHSIGRRPVGIEAAEGAS